MKGNWYCTDCEERIDKDAIEDHEDDGHRVKGRFRPERLLSSDPERLGSDAEAVEDGGGG